MVEYKVKTEKTMEMSSVVCDICGMSCKANSMEAQEFEFIRRMGGFGSIFGNEHEVTLDICQHCLEKIIGPYLIREELSGYRGVICGNTK
jgi:hypothetical protein